MNLSLKGIFTCVLGILYVWAIFASYNTGYFFELACVTTLLFLVTYFFLTIGFRANLLFLKIYVFYFIHWHLLSFPFLIGDPLRWRYSWFHIISYSDIINCFLVLSLYHIIFGLLVMLVNRKFGINIDRKPSCLLDKDFSPALWWYVLIVIFFLIQFYFMGLGRGRSWGLWSFFRPIFGWDFIFVFLMFLILNNYENYNLKKPHLKLKAIFFFVSFAAIKIIWGSKSSIYVIIIPIIIYFLTVHRNIVLRLTKSKIIVSIVLFPIAIYSFYLGNTFRMVRYYRPSEAINPVNIQQFIKMYPLDYDELIKNIFNRISLNDYLILTVTQSRSRFNTTVNILNNFKALINYLVPGDIFDNVLIMARLWDIDYFGKSFGDVFFNYHTEVPGLFATSIAFMGVAGGIFGALIIFCLYISFIYIIFHYVPKPYYKYVVLFATYKAFYLFRMMGVDEFIFSSIIVTLLQCALFIAFMFILRGWYRWT